MISRTRLILLIGSAFISLQSLACSCADSGPFIESSRAIDAIVVAEVTGYFSQSGYSDKAMNLRVWEVLKGDIGHSPVRVWGDDGRLCRPYVSQFPVGSTWIFAISKSGQALVGALERKIGVNDFEIQGCGTYWLKVEGSYAVGKVISGQKQSRIPISKLKLMLSNNNAAENDSQTRRTSP